MKITLKPSIIYTIVSAALLLGGMSAHAANQVWTNAPTSSLWTNIFNWDGGAYPGSVNGAPNTGNAVDNDVATFNQPIPVSGYGGASSPILIIDSSIATRSLEVGSIIFDTASCGAYVFQTNLPCDYIPGVSGSNGCLYVSMLSAASPTNGIFMTPTVNSIETFLVPIFIRLPSSTAGIYNFVNNSANPAATMYINAVTNDSSNTRGTVFTLGGSNTGTNTVQYLSKGASLKSAAEGFTKQGTGTWILAMPGGSDFTNTMVNNINDGKLVILDPGCWGVSSSVIINSNGIVALQNVGQTNTTINGNGTVQISGAGTLAGVAVGSGIGTTPHFNTTISSDVLTVGGLLGPTTAVTGGSATSVIHIGGAGTVVLATNSTYIGNWSADTGVLQVGATTALGTGPNLNIAAGAIVDLTPLGAGVTYNPSVSGIGGSGTGTTVGSTAATVKPDAAGTLDLATGSKNVALTYTPTTFTGDSTHPALYVSQGTLNLGGNTFTVNNAAATALGVGTYVLVQVASGNINNAGNLAANVTGTGVAAGNVGTISVSGGQVDLVVQAYVPKHLIWQGGNTGIMWDVNTTPNFLNGGVSSVFNNSDFVTFNAQGITNPVVNLTGALIPNSSPNGVLVDTTAGTYFFGSSGAIGGTASLTKMGIGTLVVSNLNIYLGNTVVSNGTIQLGANNALSANSDITLSNTASVDLNSWNASIGALNGNGIVDTIAGGTPTLTIGANAHTGTFSGILKNTAGTLAVTKANTGSETLSGANTYSGLTTVSAGTLRVASPTALGSGPVNVTLGTILDISTNITVSSITNTGTIENNSTTTTNELIIQGTSPINGQIADGPGGMIVLVNGGTTTFGTPGTYSGGTYVASGATLAVSSVAPDPVPGTGAIVASNNAAIAMPGSSSSAAGIVNTIITANNSQVTFTSANTANALAGSLVGGITSTDLFLGGNLTVGGNGNTFQNFSNFLGTVIITNGTVRGFGTLQGGQNTTFDLIGLGIYNSRDGGDIIHLGALEGDPSGSVLGATGTGNNPNTLDTYIIGEANLSTIYSGAIAGTNSIVKSGTGTLTFNGGGFLFTNVFTEGLLTVTNIGYGSNEISFVGNTTISNGVLALVAPSLLTNSPIITLAGASAVLDASSMGYVSNEFDSDGVTITNSFPVTNSIFELTANPVTGAQTLGGIGTLKGNLIADSGTTLTPGLPTGLLTVTTNASLSGAAIMDLDSTNTPATNSELAAGSFTINPSATLAVTNIGPGLIKNAKFQLFNHAVSGFASVTLPAKDPTGGTNYIWQNWIAVDGSITLTNGGVTVISAPPALISTMSGNILNLSWGAANLGFTLSVQTNPMTIGLSNNWVDVPNSSTVTSTNITINPNNPTVFYRLHN